jgi:hypothetical protein
MTLSAPLTSEDICEGFSRVLFSDLPSELLLSNRKDLKYIIDNDSFLLIFEKLKGDYDILVNDGNSRLEYKTQYYDTADFRFYSDHQRGKLPRQKIRTRTYQDGKSFLEIKSKDNKGFTRKVRNEIDISTFVINDYAAFIYDSIGFKVLPLLKTLTVNYKRVSLYDKNRTEKITFDFFYNADHHERTYERTQMVLVESKGLNHKHSLFNLLMHDMRISPISFSKYCFGLSNLESCLKINNFMPLLKTVKKIFN